MQVSFMQFSKLNYITTKEESESPEENVAGGTFLVKTKTKY